MIPATRKLWWRAFGLAGENYYARSDGRNTPYDAVVTGAVRKLWSRQSIVAMLLEVNERLAAYDAEVYLLDAYRPVACQQALWDFYWRRFARRALTMQRSPSMFATTYPTHDLSIRPAHATGAALDLTLRARKTGELLDMGTHFDDMSTASHSEYFERLLHAGRTRTMTACATGVSCIGPCTNRGSRTMVMSAGTSTTGIRWMS
jgi:D-alanyl-D-alanine dipeptidase